MGTIISLFEVSEQPTFSKWRKPANVRRVVVDRMKNSAKSLGIATQE
jgi:hypothetical protein